MRAKKTPPATRIWQALKAFRRKHFWQEKNFLMPGHIDGHITTARRWDEDQ